MPRKKRFLDYFRNNPFATVETLSRKVESVQMELIIEGDEVMHTIMPDESGLGALVFRRSDLLDIYKTRLAERQNQTP